MNRISMIKMMHKRFGHLFLLIWGEINRMRLPVALLILLFVLPVPQSYALDATNQEMPDQRKSKIAQKKLKELHLFFLPYKHVGKIDTDSVAVFPHSRTIHVFFSDAITHIPVRSGLTDTLQQLSKDQLGWRFRKYEVHFFARGRVLESYIPDLYRNDNMHDGAKRVRKPSSAPPLVTRLWQENYPGGLSGHHIALWHSHGLYYNQEKQRWQWQRARLFSTVEDIFPLAYTLQYIAPMLENAGASVLIPRERDFQTHEVIVDHDRSSYASAVEFTEGTSGLQTAEKGFLLTDTLFDHDNPFEMGKHVIMQANSGSELTYIPDIPEEGHYAVYFSWAWHPENLQHVKGEIKYAGGKAPFALNQQMGYGTWVYLGTFYFEKGKNPAQGSLVIYTYAEKNGVITADAAKFGGGMGNVARRATHQIIDNQRSINDDGSGKPNNRQNDSYDDTWKTSGYPRYTEGARYFLQYAGFPDTLVYSLNEGKNDYNDDYMSRGEWVNYLMGAPLGPTNANQTRGLNIPVDLSLAFHTDAGITKSDSVIGTLAIYSAARDNGLFPDGISRMWSRDLADIVQEQIVSDIRRLHNPDWTRRALWDREYSEAWRPNVPAVLLELLSHQNLSDMRYGLDPRFQFDVSRAIYKGITKFIAHQHQREPVIQPLPPSHLSVEQTGDKTIRISWQAVNDPLEPSADPTYFKLYTRKGSKGFDSGTRTGENNVVWELEEWETIYSFKVTSVNDGGESMPSEILAAGFVKDQEHTVLLVNGFDRISGPGVFDTEQWAGLSWWDDHAIPYLRSASYTGMQHDYKRNSPWLDDDSPGWGASYANHEKETVAGNLFDYPAIHGASVLKAGYSFVSMSRKAFENNTPKPGNYPVVDLIMGKQKTTPAINPKNHPDFELFSPSMIEKIEEYTQNGTNIIITAAYIGTDMSRTENQRAIDFAKNTLGYTWRTNNATSKGNVTSTHTPRGWFPESIRFNTQPHPDYYVVEAPDGLEPANKKSIVPYRYATNNISAAVVHHAEQYSVFAAGFPFESITSQQQRDELMNSILKLFKNLQK